MGCHTGVRGLMLPDVARLQCPLDGSCPQSSTDPQRRYLMGPPSVAYLAFGATSTQSLFAKLLVTVWSP